MGLSNFLFGKKEQMMTPSLMTGGQTNLLEQLMSGLGGGDVGGGALGAGMQSLMDILGDDTSKFEQPLMRQFQEQIIPQLGEQFGGADALGSSGFQQALGSAGSGLMERLGAMRGQLQQGAMGQLQGLMGQGLGAKQFENVYRPATSGFVGGMAPGIGAALGMGMTGGMGAAAGGVGSWLSELINPQYGAWQNGQHYRI